MPPIVIQLLRHHELAKAHDLNSVRNLHTGAAPLGPEVVEQVLKHWPHWHIGQGYGAYMIEKLSSFQRWRELT